MSRNGRAGPKPFHVRTCSEVSERERDEIVSAIQSPEFRLKDALYALEVPDNSPLLKGCSGFYTFSIDQIKSLGLQLDMRALVVAQGKKTDKIHLFFHTKDWHQTFIVRPYAYFKQRGTSGRCPNCGG
uniref:Uncharacterized protein n=1 Tax=Chromera velia CCMP2878 TaxID=1169474 RepID=A0A0G4HCV9_9ALVE|eukprot:Cvel_26331.t1-p1 / transcript=Cvel_26331.t1 / gene=Cvel_26331 / organism=Chromera_velia_CCMP2878 / gene_product=hypothetical protein / transcript_product=hypothetical protein / location=Cvel_scaffold3114:17224-17699(+) / protein_length=127 / sequence_SO=supercontig / SO=protein_coding / is_pseudo=false